MQPLYKDGKTIGFAIAMLACVFTSRLQAQTPPNDVQATTAPVAKPAGLAYDAAGNLYIAALNDHVIRKVDLNGVMTTVAGTGVEGFGGDGGAATSAELDSPADVALDASGNLYIADSHNNRVRKVANGVITTIAGTGVAGFSGDGGAATSAMLNQPVALSVDATGNVYIADCNNNRIRMVTGTSIATVAGNGEESFSGDGGPAISAGLAAPNGVAADTLVAGKFYIGDTHNQRIREVDASGTITTLAGTGVKTYTGDNSAGSVTAFARPRGLAVDTNGVVYVADADNQRIRTVTSGVVNTVAGDGQEGFSGDTGVAADISLDSPRAIAVDGGRLALTDTDNQRVRTVATDGDTYTVAGLAPPETESLTLGGPISVVYGSGAMNVTFANGSRTATGTVTLLNGSAAVSTATLSGDAALLSVASLDPGLYSLVASYPGDDVNEAIASGVYYITVTPAPVTATAKAEHVVYGVPVVAPTGTFTGVLPVDMASVSVAFTTTAAQGSPVGTYPIAAKLTGASASKYTLAIAAGSGSVVIGKAAVTTTLSSSNLSPGAASPVTFTAAVASLTTGTPTGSIQFFDGTTFLGTVALNGLTAMLTLQSLPSAIDRITAVYSGDGNFNPGTSNTVVESVGQGDFTLAVAQGAPTLLTTAPGGSATYSFTVSPVNPPFNPPISFTATGLPPGATTTFTPTGATLGSNPADFTMTVQTAKIVSALNHKALFGGGTVALALLWLPFGARLRRRVRGLRPVLLSVLILLGLGTVTGMMGCGTNSGFLGQQPQTYTIQVYATATTSGGTVLQHSTSVTLTVE